MGHKIGSGACSLVRRENKLQQLDDHVKIFMYLSLEDDDSNDLWESDWLYRVIKDIVSICS